MTELEHAAKSALERLEVLVLGLEADCEEPDCADCKPWRPIRASIEQLRTTLERVKTIHLTHAEGCWSWGPAHYMCAYNEIGKLRGWKK